MRQQVTVVVNTTVAVDEHEIRKVFRDHLYVTVESVKITKAES